MDLASLFSQHVERLRVETEKALADTGFGSLVVSRGAPLTYFAKYIPADKKTSS